MNRSLFFASICLLLFLLPACQKEQNQESEHENSESVVDPQSATDLVQDPAPEASPRPASEATADHAREASPNPAPEASPEASPDRDPTDDELNEYGLVESVEDGPYPMFTITFEFPERQMRQTFNLNIEAVNMDCDALNILEGNYATFYYVSELENNLEDLLVGGSSVFEEWAPEYDESWHRIEGVLEGAESLSGDLPGTFNVTAAGGEHIELGAFIDEAIMAANNASVVAFYSTRGVNTITYLRLSED